MDRIKSADGRQDGVDGTIRHTPLRGGVCGRDTCNVELGSGWLEASEESASTRDDFGSSTYLRLTFSLGH
jgi:hypothetical protein